MRPLALVFSLALSPLWLTPALAATKPVLVEAAMPAQPLTHSFMTPESGYRTLGPGSQGVLAVSSITVINFSQATRQIIVMRPLFAEGQSCGGSIVNGGAAPNFNLLVAPGQTVHLPFPTPMVFQPVAGQSCVAFQGTGTGVQILVNGFVQ